MGSLKFIDVFRIACVTIFSLLISGNSNSQTWQLNSLDGKKIDKPANTYQAEQKYSCELSRIGKLVVKPLVKDSVIHYELAETDSNDNKNENKSGVTLTESKSGTAVVKHFRKLKKKSLELLFTHFDEDDGTCLYILQVISNDSKPARVFYLDADGSVIRYDDNSELRTEERINAQREVNAWLTYFE